MENNFVSARMISRSALGGGAVLGVFYFFIVCKLVLLGIFLDKFWRSFFQKTSWEMAGALGTFCESQNGTFLLFSFLMLSSPLSGGSAGYGPFLCHSSPHHEIMDHGQLASWPWC